MNQNVSQYYYGTEYKMFGKHANNYSTKRVLYNIQLNNYMKITLKYNYSKSVVCMTPRQWTFLNLNTTS